MMSAVPPISTSPPVAPTGENYLTHSRGIGSWLLSQDHKRIGVMYLIAILGILVAGGISALVLRSHSDASGVHTSNIFHHVFTLPGMVMILIAVVPAIPAVLGNFVLPMMLGAKGLAFPRTNLLSFYAFCAGALVLLRVVWGGVPSNGSVVTAGAGLLILGLGTVLLGVNFIVSIHTLRPTGMTWFRMPLFLWALYGAAIVQILANGILAITVILLAADRSRHLGIFDPKFGGDPVLLQHAFWFYAHPSIYVMVLPAMGIVSELVSTFSRKHIFGYRFMAYSLIAIALLGFLVWGQHLFVSGQSGLVNVIFSLMTFGVVVPSAIQLCNWLHTLYRGSIRLQAPMLYALGFIGVFTIGILSGLFLGAIATGIYLSRTSFEVANLYYVMAGPILFGFLGGMYFWWPKITGRMVCEKWSARAAVLVFVGFNVTFFPLFIAGSRGMPSQHASDDPRYRTSLLISSIGGYILAGGLALVGLTWVQSLRRGPKAPANPWGANSLEWHTASPAPRGNLLGTVMIVGDPYDLSGWTFVSRDVGWIRHEKNDASGAATSH